MKIKEIKLAGFKSFPGECKISLNAGITSFVGPNGSGKSNIFDALRWVFGEQSMKALRCERIEDLIYISADAQNDANFAEVAITIDNEDFFPQFGAEYEIRRRFFRNGESEFFLNRVKCRLQDIQALFLNSGTLTYSFLELGEIERIIHGETKEMFDDVSGILKYQERREQTRRRLEVTEQDLLRLEDIIHEMQRSLRGLKRQVRQTRLFQELREEYRTLSLYMLKKDHDSCNSEMIVLQKQLTEKESLRQDIAQQIKTLEVERESLKSEMNVYESSKKEISEHLKAVNDRIFELERQIEEQKEKGGQIRLSKERMITSIHEKEEVLKANNGRLADYDQQLKEIDEAFVNTRRSVDSLIARIDESNQKYFQIQEEIKKINAQQQELIKQTGEIEPAVTRLRVEKENKESLNQKLDEEYGGQKTEIDNLRRSVKEVENELNQIVINQDELGKKLEILNDNLGDNVSKLQEVDNDLESRRNAFNACKLQIDSKSQSLKEKGINREITEKLGVVHRKLMRDHLKVETGYESVIDICLGDILHYYLIEELQETNLKDVPEGRYGFVNISVRLSPGSSNEVPEGGKPLSQLVKVKDFGDSLLYYLDRYYLVGSFDQAKTLSMKYPHYGFATDDGVLFREGMIIVERGDIGYFKISQSLEEQKQQLETIKNEIVFCENEKNRLNDAIESIRAEIETKKGELFSININKSECSLHFNETKRLLDRLLKEHSSLENERYSLRRSLENCDQQITEFENKLTEFREQSKMRLKDRESAEAAAGSLRTEIGQLNNELNDARIIAAGLEERRSSIKTAASRLQEDIDKMTQELSVLKQDETARQLSEVEDSINQLKQEFFKCKTDRQGIEAKMPAEALEELTAHLSRVFDELTERQKSYENVQNEIMQFKYSGFQIEHRKETALKKAVEEFKVELVDMRFEEEITDAASKLGEVKGKLEKLGEVNPLSLELYENEKKRFDEYLGQRDDIITAKRSLLNSITELDTRAKDRFFDIFDRVKQEFNFVFSNFFEGGQADLILTDPGNPLTSKVDIVVRMKGKRPKKITQLSGGERTLLAISLLLAFYLVKPAPFCILDEIDAPLDDANVVRFNKFLRDLSQRTQVIIITHNRATMEYADYIYGLTMEKPGQSKIISARLADLEKLDATM